MTPCCARSSDTKTQFSKIQVFWFTVGAMSMFVQFLVLRKKIDRTIEHGVFIMQKTYLKHPNKNSVALNEPCLPSI